MTIKYHIKAKAYNEDWIGKHLIAEVDTDSLEKPIIMTNEGVSGMAATPQTSILYDAYAIQNVTGILIKKLQNGNQEFTDIEVSILGKERIA